MGAGAGACACARVFTSGGLTSNAPSNTFPPRREEHHAAPLALSPLSSLRRP